MVAASWEEAHDAGAVTLGVGGRPVKPAKSAAELAVCTFKMVMFQVKLSTAFWSFRSFKPSLVPMLCKCSWNSMAARKERRRSVTAPCNLAAAIRLGTAETIPPFRRISYTCPGKNAAMEDKEDSGITVAGT